VHAAFSAKHTGNTFPRSRPIVCLGKCLSQENDWTTHTHRGKLMEGKNWRG
jgi:hypothetical protein